MLGEWEEIAPVKPVWACAHCGRTAGDQAGGFASYNGIGLCYPADDAERPNCYKLVAFEHHHIPCEEEGCWDGSHQERDPV